MSHTDQENRSKLPSVDSTSFSGSDTGSAGGSGSESGRESGVDSASSGSAGSAGGSGSESGRESGVDSASSGSADEFDAADAEPEETTELSVEALVADLERVTVERDQYLETSRRLQAEFENYRKQVSKRELEARERANEGLIGEMLPVLDAFDGALSSGVEAVVPMRTTLLDTLAKQGLERIDPDDAPFDPTQHEAVMHEDGDGEESGPVVAEVMRAGYLWKGRVIRPAMVRVRG